MFEMVFPDGIKRGMAFDGHAKNGAYVTRGGSMISKRDWSRLKQLAADDLPESVRAPRVPSASDEVEHRVGMLRHILRGYGLDDESCDEACEIARRELAGEPVEDALPVAGPAGMGGRMSDQTREGGEKHFRSPGHFESRPPLGTTSSSEKRSMVGEAEYRSSPASDEAFFAAFPDARRIQTGTPGSTQFDGADDRRTRRERRLAADAALDGAADGLAEMFPGIENIGVGDFPRRR
jgi:hypothetical protein